MAKKTKKIAKKATKKPASRLSEQSGGAEERHEPPVDGTAANDDPRALPEPQVRVVDVEVLRALGESLIAPVDGTLDYIVDALNRSLATTSDLRERLARIEAGMGETQRRVTLMEENQRPPAPAPDREAAAWKAGIRWTLANQCRALNLTRPTPAIVGRVMHDERAFDERTSKSPLVLFSRILNSVHRAFGLVTARPDQEAAASEQDYVHLTEDIAAIIEERSSRPKKKWAVFLNDELKPRLALLVNSGLAGEITNRVGARTNYLRFLTPMGRKVFKGWPEWADITGGISLADEEMSPDLDSVGRPFLQATVPRESQPALPPRQPSPPPPAS